MGKEHTREENGNPGWVGRDQLFSKVVSTSGSSLPRGCTFDSSVNIGLAV